MPKYNYGLLDTPKSSRSSSLHATVASTSSMGKTFEHLSDIQADSVGNLGSAEVSKDYSSGPVFQIPTRPSLKKITPLKLAPKTPVVPHFLASKTQGVTSAQSSVKSTPLHKDTPRSKMHETLKATEPSVVVTLVEGRGLARGEVGIASIDLKSPILKLSQFSDSSNYVKTMTKLQLLAPIEVIFPSTMCDSGNIAPVYKIVNENFPHSNITTIQRQYFNDQSGLEYIKKLVIEENSSVVMAVKSKYYCLASCAALIKYVEFIENMVYANRTLRVVFEGSERTAMIDAGTAAILELVVNLKNLKSTRTLFSVLNRSKTPGGTRLLRSNILQPLSDKQTILARFECVEELTESSDFFYGLQSALERFDVDIDHLISSLVQISKLDTDKTREKRINNLILLKHVVDTVPALTETLSMGKCDLFQAYSASLRDSRFCSISELLHTLFNDSCHYEKGVLNMRAQRCFAVKSGVSALLDMSRQVYSEMIDDIDELIRELGAKHELPLKSCHNSSRGFHIQVPVKDTTALPSEFIQVTKTRKAYSCTTYELKKINANMILQVNDINMLTDTLVSQLNGKIRSNIGCLYNLSEIVSTLDLLLCFAHYHTTTDCVRPEFTDTLAVKNGRHPVLDTGIRSYVPSNVYAAEGSNFNIITGPNMSGKTTYLKMIAQMQVMAQIGCFVPAEFASFRIAPQIFSRMGGNDDMESNSSTFMIEMREINYIIQNVTESSLVIIDELGRGTSSEEGVGLCWAISEYLLSEKTKHVTCSKGSLRSVQYTYALSRGFNKEIHYGLDLAQLFDLPVSVIAHAHNTVDEIDKKTDEADLNVTEQQKIDNAAYKLATRLLQVSRSSRLEEAALNEYVKGLRATFLDEVKISSAPNQSTDSCG